MSPNSEALSDNKHLLGFPSGSDGKESACNVGDLVLISGLVRSPGEGNGSPLQHSCLENPMARGYSPWGHKEWDTTERLTLSRFHWASIIASVASPLFKQ